MLINSIASKLTGVESKKQMIARVKARIKAKRASTADQQELFGQLTDRMYHVTETALSIDDFKG